MKLSEQDVSAFAAYLRGEEKSPATVEKYRREAAGFVRWLAGRELSRELGRAYKDLLSQGRSPAGVNGALAALNRLFAFLGLPEYRLRAVKTQRRIFRDEARELNEEEYRRLLDAAQEQGRERLALLMEAIGATGIRVGEVRYITVEAARSGRAEIYLKGKIRTILLPAKLCRKLLKYAKKQNTEYGEIFLTRSGRGLSRRQIWAEMKAICARAGVAPTKVFPHNLRHLFAQTFYRVCRDVVQLADVLGHSSVETTRIYLASTGVEYVRRMDRLGLIF